jgi:hypothetical protein
MAQFQRVSRLQCEDARVIAKSYSYKILELSAKCLAKLVTLKTVKKAVDFTLSLQMSECAFF